VHWRFAVESLSYEQYMRFEIAFCPNRFLTFYVPGPGSSLIVLVNGSYESAFVTLVLHTVT